MLQKAPKPQSPFQRFAARMLVRFKFIKRTPIDIKDINQIITPKLPVYFDLNIPGGQGELTILSVDLSLGENNDHVAAELLCNFSVKVKNSVIYNTHLQLALIAKPKYSTSKKSISLMDIKITSMDLISDEYSVIQDTRTLITGVLPEPLRTIFASTISVTSGILESIGINELIKYLSLYLSGSKQRVLDYHRHDIEKQIMSYAKSDSLTYQMDESDFEEKLFSEFGKQVTIENGQLIFIFHH